MSIFDDPELMAQRERNLQKDLAVYRFFGVAEAMLDPSINWISAERRIEVMREAQAEARARLAELRRDQMVADAKRKEG